jgi:hypothetical protein
MSCATTWQSRLRLRVARDACCTMHILCLTGYTCRLPHRQIGQHGIDQGRAISTVTTVEGALLAMRGRLARLVSKCIPACVECGVCASIYL